MPGPSVELTLIHNLLSGICEEMGIALTRSSFSPNIKERRDFSCALFDGRGRLVAQGAHLPVHLGSMPMSVASALAKFTFAPGDVVLLNDPYAGGTHLPDLTMVSPVFLDRRAGVRSGTPYAFVANRAHHADVGGMSPGSMPRAREIVQEGVRIPPIKLVERGRENQAVLELLLANVRTPRERLGDLRAQLAANELGARRLVAAVEKHGARRLQRQMSTLLGYSERLMRATLRAIPNGRYRFEDWLDDDGVTPNPIPIRVEVVIRDDHAVVDFTGSAPEVEGSVNAIAAITCSATWYCFLCLAADVAPPNAGCFAPIRVIAPVGSVVNARFPRPVAGGNVETSQRIVDVVFGALAQAVPDRIPAASYGTMNNLTLGGQGPHGPFAYYETTAGGMGARPNKDGVSGVHMHMTNTLNTPVEALEQAYPLRVEQYALRTGSGGAGMYRGGDGVVRELRVLAAARGTILSERRRFAPYGLRGGGPGRRGRNLLIRNGRNIPLPGKCDLDLQPGDRLRLETPGGGGFGPRPRRPTASDSNAGREGSEPHRPRPDAGPQSR